APVGSARSSRYRFVAVWPEVECRLLDMLHRRGITREVAEDAVQTAAERAYARQLDFDSPGELFAWCSVTAWRAALKAVRKDGRVDLGGVPERSRPEDVESQARQRMALQAVAGAIERMPVDDRA